MPKYSTKKMPKIVKDYLHKLMVDNKIESVHIGFSGSGDDGNIDRPEFSPRNVDVVGEDIVRVPRYILDALIEEKLDGGFVSPKFGSVNHVEFVSLYDVFEKILENWIYNNCPIDWVNNEGGAGSCVARIKNNKLEIEVNVHEWVMEEGPNYSCKI